MFTQRSTTIHAAASHVAWALWIAFMAIAVPAKLWAEGPIRQPDSIAAAIPPIEFLPEDASPFGPRPSQWAATPAGEILAPLVATDIPIEVPPPPPAPAYNGATNAVTWLPGSDDRFGILSFESFPALDVGHQWDIVSGVGFHFLDGPVQTDMPPRLFDFTIGYQRRELVRPNFSYDIAFRVGAFSDFEGSARKGIRFPGHAVAFLQLDPQRQLVLGIEYLDRDDISLLPVAGAVFKPVEYVQVDAVFPRPRLAVEVMGTDRWIYLAGELGGGTWAIERVDQTSDNVTYRDLRLVLGVEQRTGGGPTSSLEIGYVFDRELSYRSGIGDYGPQDTLMLRSVASY